MRRGRFHREDGPAVVGLNPDGSESGTRLWYWNGVRVPRHVIENPRSRPVDEILRWPNVEVRRAWLEAYGLEQALRDLKKHGKAQVIHETKTPPRRLWQLTAFKDIDQEFPLYVEVTCPSTGRRYFLRVEPKHTTCEAAIASTFAGVGVDVYAKAIES